MICPIRSLQVYFQQTHFSHNKYFSYTTPQQLFSDKGDDQTKGFSKKPSDNKSCHEFPDRLLMISLRAKNVNSESKRRIGGAAGRFLSRTGRSGFKQRPLTTPS